jgi:hypothetical protein
MNIALPQAEVAALCARAEVAISAIEPLPSGGTHLVCTRGEGAEEMRRQLREHIVEGVVKRFPFYRSRGPW